MNGDTSVVEPISDKIAGQLLFATFMVVSNWAILAILTSVVSDNMMSTSAKANEEDEARQKAEDDAARVRRLNTLFHEIDCDQSGSISSEEWYKVLHDRSLHHELMEATGLGDEDLNDYFECLAQDDSQQALQEARKKSNKLKDKKLEYDTFINSLKDEGVLADKRSILHVMATLRNMEARMAVRFADYS